MLSTIKQGTNGNLVKIAQYLTGFAARKEATGNFNAKFVAHILTWQRNHGLTSDGIIGPKTWAAIAKAAPTCSTGRNNKSAAVCALQLLIGKLTVDGIFGSLTKKAVAAYQSAKGLTVDGCVGVNTWMSNGLASTNFGSFCCTNVISTRIIISASYRFKKKKSILLLSRVTISPRLILWAFTTISLCVA